MKSLKISYLLLVSLSVILFASCKDDDTSAVAGVGIEEFKPQKGGYDTQILINGTGFPLDASRIAVSINSVNIPILRSNEEQLLIQIPKNKEIGEASIVIKVDDKEYITTKKFTYLQSRRVVTIAGTGARGYQDGPGDQAQFCFTTDWNEQRRGGIDVDDNLNVYVSDAGNMAIRKISPEGVVSTVSRNFTDNPDWGLEWRNDNGGLGTYNAQVRPADLTVDSQGNIYSLDAWIGSTVKYEPDGKAHYMGINNSDVCESIAIDEANNRLYLSGSNVIKMKALDNIGPNAVAATIIASGADYRGLKVDKRTGDLYAVVSGGNKVVKFEKDQWNNPILIAGSGVAGMADGARSEAKFTNPWGIAITADGNLLVAGNGTATAVANPDQSIRYIDLAAGKVSTFAGSGTAGNDGNWFYIEGYHGITLPSTEFKAANTFSAPTAVAIDKNGDVYVLDRGNNVVKKIINE